ncbi:Gfo/Idh/MocA family oxidoreductase [Paenirhodobacter populi]|uniref:Gfo/Idh/MocA family oxidoreductase n=1 Tax=Paenirhodobacter populi TaxID=2306993 RepID=UPI003620236B
MRSGRSTRHLATVREQLAARLPGTAAYSSVDALVSDPSVDAVLVASPSALHARHALACLGHRPTCAD